MMEKLTYKSINACDGKLAYKAIKAYDVKLRLHINNSIARSSY